MANLMDPETIQWEKVKESGQFEHLAWSMLADLRQRVSTLEALCESSPDRLEEKRESDHVVEAKEETKHEIASAVVEPVGLADTPHFGVPSKHVDWKVRVSELESQLTDVKRENDSLRLENVEVLEEMATLKSQLEMIENDRGDVSEEMQLEASKERETFSEVVDRLSSVVSALGSMSIFGGDTVPTATEAEKWLSRNGYFRGGKADPKVAFFAARNGRLDVLQWLDSQARFVVNFKEDYQVGMTVAMVAAAGGFLEILKWLYSLDIGNSDAQWIDWREKDSEGLTVALHAAKGDFTPILDWMRSCGLLTEKDLVCSYPSIFSCAIESGSLATMKWLVDAGFLNRHQVGYRIAYPRGVLPPSWKNLELLQWAHSYGVLKLDGCLERLARESTQPEIIAWIQSLSLPYNRRTSVTF